MPADLPVPRRLCHVHLVRPLGGDISILLLSLQQVPYSWRVSAFSHGSSVLHLQPQHRLPRCETQLRWLPGERTYRGRVPAAMWKPGPVYVLHLVQRREPRLLKLLLPLLLL